MLTPEAQAAMDAMFADMQTIASYLEKGANDGLLSVETSNQSKLQYVPFPVSAAIKRTDFFTKPQHGKLVVKDTLVSLFSPNEADTANSVNIGDQFKAGYAILLKRQIDKTNPSISYALTKDERSVLALAGKGAAYAALFLPDAMRTSALFIEPAEGARYVKPTEKSPPRKDGFVISSRNVAWLSASAAAGALLVFLLRKK